MIHRRPDEDAVGLHHLSKKPFVRVIPQDTAVLWVLPAAIAALAAPQQLAAHLDDLGLDAVCSSTWQTVFSAW